MSNQRKWAILVGVNEYIDPAVQSLKYSVNDVKSLYEILVDPNRGGYEKDYALLITDGAERKRLPTRNNVMYAVNSIARIAEPDDTILFAFSGHGMEEKGLSYLLLADARTGVLADTAIPLKWVKDQFGESPAKAKIMILDACHAGAMIGKANIGPMSETFSNEIFKLAEGFATLSSCKLNEASHEWTEKQHGAFSYYLIEGLKGEADSDKDGLITVPEASRYVHSRVIEWAFKRNFQQSPTLEYRVSGEMLLVHVPESFQRVTPAIVSNARDKSVASITLLHREVFEVGEPFSEFAYREKEGSWYDTEHKAISTLKRLANSLCATLLDVYNVSELVPDEKGNYKFPDGLISISTSFDFDEQLIDGDMELTIKYDVNRRTLIDSLVIKLSAEKWRSLEYRFNRKFDVNKLVELCKKSDIKIKSYDPSGESAFVTSAPGWGAFGKPATVRFWNSDDGSVVKIFQVNIEGEFELEDKFYEKLNPRTIVEFVYPAFMSS